MREGRVPLRQRTTALSFRSRLVRFGDIGAVHGSSGGGGAHPELAKQRRHCPRICTSHSILERRLAHVGADCVIEVLGGSVPPMILTMPSEIEVAAEASLCGCVTLSQEELNLAISLGSCGSGRRSVDRRSEMDFG